MVPETQDRGSLPKTKGTKTVKNISNIPAVVSSFDRVIKFDVVRLAKQQYGLRSVQTRKVLPITAQSRGNLLARLGNRYGAGLCCFSDEKTVWIQPRAAAKASGFGIAFGMLIGAGFASVKNGAAVVDSTISAEVNA